MARKRYKPEEIGDYRDRDCRDRTFFSQFLRSFGFDLQPRLHGRAARARRVMG
jgi:hypothetical protein